MQDIDLKRARLDPAAVFSSPEAVAEHPELSREQKTDLLMRWKYDAYRLEVAEDENMMGDRPSILDRVVMALEAMVAEGGR